MIYDPDYDTGTPLGAALTEFAEMPISTVIREDLGTALAFPELEAPFEEVSRCAREMLLLPLGRLPQTLTTVALTAFGMLRGPIETIQNYNIDKYQQYGTDLKQARQQLFSTAEAAIRKFFLDVAPVYAYAAAQRSSPSEARLAEIEKTGTVTLDSARQRSEELDTILAAAREASGKVGVSTHSTLFKTEAAKHETASLWWLLAAGLLGLLTLAAAIISALSVLNRTTPLTAAQSAQIIVAKVILFSILGSAAIWCAKMYRAHRHNAVVNRHRQNALSTFETFAAATDDPQTKNAVLIQATTSIFAPQSSGYGGDSDPHSPAQLIELIRTLPGSK